MTTDATVAPRRMGARRRYSEQVHVLVDEATRAYLLGVAVMEAEEGGYERPREGEEVRGLLDEAILRRYEADPAGYAKAVTRGRQKMRERAWQAAYLAARNAGMASPQAKAQASREVPPVAPGDAGPPPA